MTNSFDLLIDGYLDNKIGIDPLFLTPALSAGLQQHIGQLQQDGLLTPGGIGNEAVKAEAQQMRGDEVYWLDKAHTNVFEQQFLQQADAFIARLNSTCYAGINASEFHYAVYPAGGFYRRHLDQFRSDSNRKYSLISYLNDDWLVTDGGQLVVYPSADGQQILPHAQTAVFFKSDELEHEVTMAHRPRMSISGWLKRV